MILIDRKPPRLSTSPAKSAVPGLCFLIFIALAASGVGSISASDSADPASLRKQYSLSRSNYLAQPNNTTSAWKFARATFELAESVESDKERAELAHEGIESANAALRKDSTNAPAHLYLALNIGQLARTKLLSALGMVKEMEKELLASIKADENFDHASAHRSLGMLYVEAPGWPASIGSKSKARQHLEKSIELAPDYPDNHLSALEAYARWDDQDSLRRGIARYLKILPVARQQYSSEEWAQPWKDWDERWAAVRAKARTIE